MPPKKKENVPPKGPKKRARSNNDEDSPDVISTKKQRVEAAEEAGSEEATVVRRSASTRIRKPTQRYALEDSLAVPGSRAKNKSSEQQQQQQNRKVLPGHNKKPPARGGKRQKVAAPEVEASIYEMPDSADELLALPATKKRGKQAAPEMSSRPESVAPVEATGTAKKGVSSAVLDVSPNSATPAPEEGDQPVKKRRGRPPRSQGALVDAARSTTASPAPSISKDQTTKSQTSHNSRTEKEPTPELKAPRVRGRKEDLVDDAQKPKGILTPSKRGADGRTRKNVVFSGMQNGEDEPEAPESPSSFIRGNGEQLVSNPEVEPETESGDAEEEEVQDDEVCSVCSKPDSKRGNMIIFCDNCNMAVHQKCYGVATIPKGDWFCKDCSGDKVGPINQAAKESVAVATEVVPDIPNFEQHLRAMQRVLIDRCTGKRRLKLRNLDDVYEKAYQLVEQTIVAGEGNSMLVIGARGSGKTTMMESVLSNAYKEHKNQFHVVRLNGFIHTDDKVALRYIWRQLGREMEVEDDLIDKTNNYADTMASLLALLSHPTEIAGDAQDGVTSKSVIFLIDEFDLFATHARQTLLYNLFDIAQARKAPIAVIGMTTRIDVVESLEKRVKSRFSHRYVYLSLPKSLPAYWEVCRQALCVDDQDMRSEGIDQTVTGHSQFWKWWNERVEALYKTHGFQDRLQYHFYTTKSVTAFLRGWIIPLSLLSPEFPALQPPGPNHGQDTPDSKVNMLESLSDLDLSMLIAAARLDIVAHTDTVNFAMAYDEYASLMGRQRVQSASSGLLAIGGGARVWGRGVAGIAWERLVKLGLLVPAAPGARMGGGTGSAVQGQGGIEGKMWKVDVALEEIPAATKLNAILARWCREI